jgi:hypothetical protein
MKRFGILILFFLIYWTVYSQDTEFNRQWIIGAFFEAGMNQPIRLTRKYVTEDVGPFHGYESVSMGLKFSRMINQQLRLEIATGYSLNKCGFELSPPIYPESKTYPETIKTFIIPVSMTASQQINFYGNVVELSEEYYQDQQECLETIGKYIREKTFSARHKEIPPDLIGPINYPPEEVMVESIYRLFTLNTQDRYNTGKYEIVPFDIILPWIIFKEQINN